MRLLTANDLKVLYGEIEIFSDISLEIHDTDRIGLVGPNGGGKTSLLNVLVGGLTPNAGTVNQKGGMRVGYVPQKPSPVTNGTLRDEINSAFDMVKRLEERLAESALDIQNATGTARRNAERRYADLLHEYEAVGGYDLQNRMDQVIDGVGLSTGALDTPFEDASGGEKTRTALARALLTDPDLLVLDEPTNYLDFKGLAWLETFLTSFSHAFLVVSHDRYFLDQVANTIWEMDNGKLSVYKGNYTKYRQIKSELAERQRLEYERQKEFIAKEQAFIDRYRAGQRSREAKGREKRLQRVERLDAPTTEKAVRISGVEAGRTGLIVMNTRALRVGYRSGGSETTLLSIPDLDVERGAKIAIIGANGIGKTTLLRTMTGSLPPLSGRVDFGHNVKPGYFQQGNIDLDDDDTITVLDAMLDVSDMTFEEARGFLGRFLFSGDDVFKSVGALSGGERGRLSVARLLISNPNLLVLDEPTTHLDIPSREALEQALSGYTGTLIFVSHDRRLISRLANALWMVENGTIMPFEGTFEEWTERQRAAEQESERARKAPQRRRIPDQKAAIAKAEPEIDHEAVIAALEAKLTRIESNLQRATQKQDIAKITSLGEAYVGVRQELEAAWQAWSG